MFNQRSVLQGRGAQEPHPSSRVRGGCTANMQQEKRQPAGLHRIASGDLPSTACACVLLHLHTATTLLGQPQHVQVHSPRLQHIIRDQIHLHATHDTTSCRALIECQAPYGTHLWHHPTAPRGSACKRTLRGSHSKDERFAPLPAYTSTACAASCTQSVRATATASLQHTSQQHQDCHGALRHRPTARTNSGRCKRPSPLQGIACNAAAGWLAPSGRGQGLLTSCMSDDATGLHLCI